MTERRSGLIDLGPVALHFPFQGRWTARNSPARRVPSQGTHVLGTTYAIDFVAVDERGHSAPWGWRAALGRERPESFVGFGRPILAPVSGTVSVSPGRQVAPGERIGACGNSGNSTQPHVHVQATDLLPTAGAAWAAHSLHHRGAPLGAAPRTAGRHRVTPAGLSR